MCSEHFVFSIRVSHLSSLLRGPHRDSGFTNYFCFSLSPLALISSAHVLCNPPHSRSPLLPEFRCQPHYLQPTVSPLPGSIPQRGLPSLQTPPLPGPPARATGPEERLPHRMPPGGADRRRVPTSLASHPSAALPWPPPSALSRHREEGDPRPRAKLLTASCLLASSPRQHDWQSAVPSP